VHDVTQGQWQAVMGNNPSAFSRQGANRAKVSGISEEELKLFPVETVSWDDAQEFLQKLNEKERGRGYWYRLPTDAEWEYACRGGATSLAECSFPFYLDKPSNDLSSDQANFNGEVPFRSARRGKNLGRPTRVGSYPPNKLGLCDMHGNVWQWCANDYWEKERTVVAARTVGSLGGPFGQGPLLAASLLSHNPPNLWGSSRVSRGGGWEDYGPMCCAAARHEAEPVFRFNLIGFRLARVPVR
jgi:formylglycine-generating enzyme required for sulfatase activity